MPTPQAMPVAIGRDHQKPGGGGKKNGGYATHGHGPYTTVGLNDGTKTTDGCAGSITMTWGGGADCWTTTVCVSGAGYVASRDDCANSDRSGSPGAGDTCFTLDNDCDAAIDDDDTSLDEQSSVV